MWTCKKCEGTNIITVTEISKKGEKKPLSFCNDCGNESDRIEDIVKEEK